MPEYLKGIVNKLVLALLIGVTLGGPLYLGLWTGYTLGDRYYRTAARYPVPSLRTYGEAAFNPPWVLTQKYIEFHQTVKRAISDPTYGKSYEYYYFNNKFTLLFYAPLGFGFFIGLIMLFLMRAPLMDFRPYRRKEKIHGDAKWSSELDIRRAKMRAKKGLLMGRTGANNYLICDDFQHVLLFAPTGSGKGVGFVIPNLLFWEESVVVHDIKGENFELTSGYRNRKLGQTSYYWNPADPNGISHCYNPLDWISEKPGQMVDDVQKICNLVLPEQEFWQNEARSLMLGVILYLCAVPEKVTSFGEVVRTMRSDDVVYNLAVVLDTIGGKIHPVAYMNIAAFLQKADKERSGVVSTLNSGLELWANPLIDTTTASSDFDLQTLKKKKQSVFVGVTPDNLQRLEPLLKVFYQQATDFMTRQMPKADEPFGVMFMMDEFPSLGEMPQFQVGIAYFRGYRVKLFLIVQDTQQLKGIYEEAGMNSFLSNSYYRITFSANNIETANMISQLVGNKTAVQESNNRPKFIDFNPASRTMQVSETQRALLLPQEVIQLPRDEQIILVESFPPIKCKKIFYFKDPFFKKRLLPPMQVPVQEPYDPRKNKKKVAAAPPPPPGGGDKKGNSGDKAGVPATSGFTLVEIAIVLTLIAMLVGGILAGQSLIRSATLRGLSSEADRYVQAVQIFKDKYQGLPGDLSNATYYWGDDNTNCADAGITNGNPGTCNGDSNGIIAWATEGYRAWQQLAFSGYIDGNYSGTATSNTAVIGTNVPRSRQPEAGWSFVNESNAHINSAWNGVVLGAAVSTSYTNGAALKPLDAGKLDDKMDDGEPDAGGVRTLSGTSCTSGSAPAAIYARTDTRILCSLYFKVDNEK